MDQKVFLSEKGCWWSQCLLFGRAEIWKGEEPRLRVLRLRAQEGASLSWLLSFHGPVLRSLPLPTLPQLVS